MELSIQIQSTDSYLHIRVVGTYDIQKAKALFEDAVRAADDQRQFNILIDYRDMQGSASMMENYEYSDFVARYLQNRLFKKDSPQLRLAYLGSGLNFDPSRFAETVAVNRGVDVLNTDSMEKAG